MEATCPYCGEALWIPVDPSEGTTQQFVSDCETCCRPIEFVARVDRHGAIELDVRAGS